MRLIDPRTTYIITNPAAALLLGAQVIAEYERIEISAAPQQPEPMHIDAD